MLEEVNPLVQKIINLENKIVDLNNQLQQNHHMIYLFRKGKSVDQRVEKEVI